MRWKLLTVMRRFVIALLTVPVVRLQQDLYQQQHRLQTNSETLSDPWNDQRARQWFIGGDNNVRRHYDPDMPELGRLNSDNPLEIHKNSEQVPVVGQNIDIKDYQPSWQTRYKIKQKSDQKSIPNINAQSQYLPELNSNNQREVDVEAYNSFPGSLLPPVPSSDNLERPQNNSNPWSQIRQDAVPGRGSRLPNLHQDEQRVNDQGSDSMSDLLARQNYWDSSLGYWPTHTVNPSNINILEKPQTPPGQLCPTNWDYFGGSCYLLRNQELFPGELVTTLYKASWYTAKATCNALGAYLTEIESEDEHEFIEDIKKKNHVALLWTGATDFGQDGYWTWSQSKNPVKAYQHWARPPWRAGVLGPVGRGHCMALRRDGKWDSFRCPNKFPYLCERNSSVSLVTSSTTTSTTPSTSTTSQIILGKDECYSMTVDSTSWVKLSSKLLTHPQQGRCWIKIVFSTFSNGLLLRKFDWNNEAITLVIVGGQLVFKMATGSSQDISVSSPYIVTDGLEHEVVVSFGVGFISLQVDGDHDKVAEDYSQPGLAHDANVFLAGEPGGEFSGYSGCIESVQIWIAPTKFSQPDWTAASKIDFSQKTSLTILYGDVQCGVCSMRNMMEEEQEADSNASNWEVSELPRPMTSWVTPYSTRATEEDRDESERGYPDSKFTEVVDFDTVVDSKPILVLDGTSTTTSTTSTSTTTTTASTTSTSTTTTTATTKTLTTTMGASTITSFRKKKVTSPKSRPTTEKTRTTMIMTTKSSTFVRNPCVQHQLSLDGSGWVELSPKLMPQKVNYRTVITVNFASRQQNSLLLWQGDYRTGHYFAVALRNGFLEFRFNLGSVPAVIRSAKLVNDGQAHEVVIIREDNKGSVQVDGGPIVPGFTKGEGEKMKVRRTPIFLAGAPSNSLYLPSQATLYKTAFKGCILEMKVWNNKIVDDDSGLGGFGAEIDFTNNKMVRDLVNINCVDQCQY